MGHTKRWTHLYPEHIPKSVEVEHANLPEGWKARVARDPDNTALVYFDRVFSAAEVDRKSDALAAALAQRGIGKGDCVGLKLQNIPQFPLALLALWKLGASALLINPMYRQREFRRLVDDSGAKGVIVEDTLFEETRSFCEGSDVEWLLTTSSLDYQTRNDPRVFASTERLDAASDGDVCALIEQFDGSAPPPVQLNHNDVAVMVYTSGTTGPAKGAPNTHGNLLHIAATNSAWLSMTPEDVTFAAAPLFHITGVGAVNTTALLHGGALVFANRPKPDVLADAFREHGAHYMLSSITVYNALLQADEVKREHFASAKALLSGGAPTPPATVEAFADKFGIIIGGAYGMTEITSAIIASPPGHRAPVHSASGTLSVGVPLPNVDAAVIGLDGSELPPGEEGELAVAGPQVISGYWNNPEATEKTIVDGMLRTGDSAIMDEYGWIYLVDRLKDQINASGFKVWPREVEDVLYEHPAVYEAAVIGKPDEYRGETVVAFVSLHPNTPAEPSELRDFCSERLAAFKRPTEITIVDELPKTETGKIQRRALR
ncbi:class I adenylate-forming enzyme family protein [Brevibacterium sp. Marseille-P9724]|uniref:class I adenylate-forming enzyme family protein n=1 Tax=Brevibacterium sp. Marseille-P9724 TaxID=2614125 RepID=UPI00125EFA3C|nr:AMP-binding protein [Brevibacterium sp. Marseille-P9724]